VADSRFKLEGEVECIILVDRLLSLREKVVSDGLHHLQVVRALLILLNVAEDLFNFPVLVETDDVIKSEVASRTIFDEAEIT